MQPDNQRKMLFLYPEALYAHDLRKIREMMNLVADLNYITNEVNEFIKKINEKYLIKDNDSLPKVVCSSVSDFEKVIHEYHNVRICLLKHNDVDYSSSYTKVIKTYESNLEDISHLISVTINSDIKNNNIRWTWDSRGSFDVNIETNLNQLRVVLISVMIDIILYRHFNLSNDLSERKRFSLIKRDYILKTNKDIQKYYNNTPSELRKTKYLSVCYLHIYSYYLSENRSLDKLVKDLFEEYWSLVSSTLFTEIKLRENFVMYDTENRYKTFTKDVQVQISDIIPDFCRISKIELPLLLAIRKDAESYQDCSVINNANDFIRLNADEYNYFRLSKV